MSNTIQSVSPPVNRKVTADSASTKVRNGFCLKSELTAAERRYILDNYPGATATEIVSVRLSGGKRYSIHELIGYSVKGMVYVVVDLPRFNSVMSGRLEKDFLEKNPNPDSHIRAAFTSFMHQNKLHWSKCCGRSTLLHKMQISQKLRTLSERNRKPQTRILSELLDRALKESS